MESDSNRAGEGAQTMSDLGLPKRFWVKVQKCDDGCWRWTGGRNNAGYGRFFLGGQKYAHRVSFEAARGPVPAGLELDHICRVTECVNPEHLEPVTHAENIRRGWAVCAVTHCKRGHEFTPENTYVYATGSRSCVTCRKQAARARVRVR